MQEMQLRASRNNAIYRALQFAEASMYVCLCNALTDRDVRAKTADGTRSVAMVYRACGCQPQCGKCVPAVLQMLREGGETSAVGLAEGAD
jgi:bacterioferritin-associated ferredoxin